MNKNEILNCVIAHLTELKQQATTAAANAHNAAIDDQSVAETQYDTLAIEAAYLAEGQSRRIEDLKEQIHQLTNMKLKPCDTVELGALIQIAFENGDDKLFFMLPYGAGTQVEYENKVVFIITTQAPLAQALLNKVEGDEFTLAHISTFQCGEITNIV